MADRSLVIEVRVAGEGVRLGNQTASGAGSRVNPATPKPGHVATWHGIIADGDIASVVADITTAADLYMAKAE